MSYYILPKINNNTFISFSLKSDKLPTPTHISHSLVEHLNEIHENINRLLENEDIYSLENLVEAINPYQHLFTKIPNYSFAVSKLKPYSASFFEFMELAQTVNLFENFQNKTMQYSYLEDSHQFVSEYMSILREDNNDKMINLQKVNYTQYYHSFDFLYYELKRESDINASVIEILNSLINISFFQKQKGICVIKINDLIHKPLIEILFILSSLYEKCYIIKPNTCDITSNERYFVCKNFRSLLSNYFKQQLIENIEKIKKIKDNGEFVYSLIQNEISYYFITKLEESNIIIGELTIETLNKMISVMKNKNKEEKIELMRKSNIQKCISWCEKYKLPYNKFTEKVNIFLPPYNSYKQCIDDSSDINIDSDMELVLEKDGDLLETVTRVESTVLINSNEIILSDNEIDIDSDIDNVSKASFHQLELTTVTKQEQEIQVEQKNIIVNPTVKLKID
jgi:hypothetical protein